MKMDERSKKFLADYNDKIEELVNQDMVRLEQVRREWDNGYTKDMLDTLHSVAGYAYQTALANGFDDLQAFELAKKAIGYE